MKIAIEASTIRSGGGIRHLIGLLRRIDSYQENIEKVSIWCNDFVLSKLDEFNNIEINTNKYINGNLITYFLWQYFIFDKKVAINFDIVLVLGGIYLGGQKKLVTVAHNLLPFDNKAKNLTSTSERLKLLLIQILQKQSFKKSSGVIFFTKISKNIIEDKINYAIPNFTIIPHGLNKSYGFGNNKNDYSFKDEFRWLYVSTINPYKNHFNLIKAIYSLRQNGYPIKIDLVGNSNKQGNIILNKIFQKFDPNQSFIKYHGSLTSSKLKKMYKIADGYAYSSICETFGLTVLEAMSFGLPIACSRRSSMKEILGDAGLYFNPFSVESITSVLEYIFMNQNVRSLLGKRAHKRSLKYSWDYSANKTLKFLCKVGKNN